jgi:uncharacterized protein YhjY with autotransporter beta-barrel domain
MGAARATSSLASVWRERIVAQQHSGESIRGWCQANYCHEHSFYWWRANLGLSPMRNARRRESGGKPVEFAKVVVQADAAVATAVEAIRLSLIGGRELILPMSMPVEQIARLVRAIEGAP